ncbi:hypothetical protein L6452_34551 [Arctium lappa]|uniref:Uncharacterized protein n=1 Tax=Arctium lappa TaxID=4217 RepID=A0ACB8YJ17_ARCLA|nr:hypothetical protein L6452_34551 [Arctium lappa]
MSQRYQFLWKLRLLQVQYLQLQSGAKIQVTRNMDTDPHSLTTEVELTGSAKSKAKVKKIAKYVLVEI